MSNYLWLSGQAYSCLIDYWPFTIGLLLPASVAFFIVRQQLFQSPARIWLRLVAPFAFPPIILAWGSVMRDSDPYSTAWQSDVLSGFFFTAVAFFALVVWRSSGLRWFAFSIVLFALWPILLAEFFSSMSIANDWL